MSKFSGKSDFYDFITLKLKQPSDMFDKNKVEVYIENPTGNSVKCTFNTEKDFIPYYPHAVNHEFKDTDGKLHLTLSSESIPVMNERIILTEYLYRCAKFFDRYLKPYSFPSSCSSCSSSSLLINNETDWASVIRDMVISCSFVPEEYFSNGGDIGKQLYNVLVEIARRVVKFGPNYATYEGVSLPCTIIYKRELVNEMNKQNQSTATF